MAKTIVSIDISKDEILRYYSGDANNVIAQDFEGKTVQFPANILRQFVTKDGVRGVFEIEYDVSGKMKNVKRIQ